MTDVREATDDLLAEKPDLESELRDLLAVDDRLDGWTFDDVALDSGTFGELVSRGIVVKDGDEYEVADRDAVRASLDGEEVERGSDGGSSGVPSLSFSIPSVSRVEAGALAAALAFVVLMRAYIYPSVFRHGHVVLSSNDPYYYRYWVEKLAANATGVFDLSVLSGLPGAVAKGEPLMVGTLWWFSNLLGGASAAGWVLAWYPVVSAVIVAVLVYAMAVRVTDDKRVGLMAVTFLAVIPAFAFRTGLGFSDHHAFDYPWLALTALSLVSLADVNRERLSSVWTWVWSVMLGIAVAGQVMAWEAGPLLIGAIGFYVAVRAAADVRADRSTLVAVTPVVVGLAIASVLTHLLHTGFGWHTDVVTYSPALLLVGVVGVAVVGEAVRRVRMPAFVLGSTELAGALVGVVALQTVLPAYASKLLTRTNYLLFKSGPAETRSMFAGGPTGFFIGPILNLGFAWILGLPVLVWLSWKAYRRERSGWLLVCSYGWFFLALSALQRRFVGELALFIAVLAGYGFVLLAAKLDVISALEFGKSKPTDRRSNETDAARSPSLGFPDQATMTTLAILVLFVSSAGAVQTAVRHEQVKIKGDKVDAALWMHDYAQQQGWEYPQNYVLSKWGRNRMYNYFVNRQSQSYAYAQRHYESFLSAHNPTSQYRKLRDHVGFVVTKNLDVSRVPPESNYARLHKRWGSSGSNGANGTGHYRAVYASDDGSVKVFTLVPGAEVVGNASPNTTLTLSKNVKIEGASFTYRRVVEVGADGNFSVIVPYSGAYTIGNQTVQVSKKAVMNHGNVSVGT